MAKEMKEYQKRASVETARQLFLYGSGDGKRIIGTKELANAAGCHEATVRKWLPTWIKEHEESLEQKNNFALGINLSKEDIAFHSANQHFLADQIKQCKFELKQLEAITAQLKDFVIDFNASSDDPSERAECLTIFSNWIAGAGRKATLRQSLLAMKKQWEQSGGVVSAMEIAVTYQKGMQAGRAKMDVKREEGEANRREAPRTVSGFFEAPVDETEAED